MSDRRVVVTGYGAICSLGDNVPAIWDAILSAKLGYRRHDFPGSSIKARFFGFIDPDNRRYVGLPKSILKMAPSFARYAMLASRQALDMAFGDNRAVTETLSPFDVGVVFGTGWGGADAVL